MVWKVHSVLFSGKLDFKKFDIRSSQSQGRLILCQTLEGLRIQSCTVVLELEVGAYLRIGGVPGVWPIYEPRASTKQEKIEWKKWWSALKCSQNQCTIGEVDKI